MKEHEQRKPHIKVQRPIYSHIRGAIGKAEERFSLKYKSNNWASQLVLVVDSASFHLARFSSSKFLLHPKPLYFLTGFIILENNVLIFSVIESLNRICQFPLPQSSDQIDDY